MHFTPADPGGASDRTFRSREGSRRGARAPKYTSEWLKGHGLRSGNSLRKPTSLLLALAMMMVAAITANPGAAAAGTTTSTPTAPSAPTKFRVKSGCSGVLLSWAPPRTGNPVTSYSVYRSSDRVWFAFLASTTDTSYTDMTGGTNVRNYYRVTAVNDVGEGKPTGISGGTMTCAPPDASPATPNSTTTTTTAPPTTTTTTAPPTTTTTTAPPTTTTTPAPPT